MPSPTIRGIHHVKIAVSDLERSLKFYEHVFLAKRIVAWDHKHEDNSTYAYILEVPGLGTYLELRLNPEQAEKHRLFDTLTIAVKDRAELEQWDAFLNMIDIAHSSIIVGLQAWVIVIEDPDQQRLRLYTLETHGPEIKPDESSYWLQT